MTRIALFPSTAVTCNDNFDVIDEAAIHIEDGLISLHWPVEYSSGVCSR
jgi:hypothetical protein